MKTTKKLATLFLAMVMVFAMVIPTLAAETGSIKINNPTEGQVYTIYKMFDLESYSGSAYSYKIETTSDWYDFVTGTGYGATYFDVDTQGYVTAKGTPAIDPVELAKEALQYATDNGISGTSREISAADQAAGSYTFTDLPLGYYVIDSSVGTLCALTTTQPNAELTEKNEEPTITKTVEGVATSTASIGDTVHFAIQINAKKGAQKYILHDTMDAGLSLDTDSFAVKVGTTDVADTNYVITTTTTSLTDGCTFEISFKQDYLDTITADTTIDVTYTAKVDKDAVIGSAGNKNTAKLTYGDHHETTPASTTTYTYSFDLVKTKSDKKVLSGAEFELYNAETAGTKINLVKVSTGKYRVADANEVAETDFTSATIEAGKVTISGLGNGTYYLQETKAPVGYNKLAARTPVTIANANLDATMDTTDTDLYVEGGVQVVNLTGTELPSTGGIGTTIFYVAGSLLAVGAIILLVTKKRMNSNI